MNVIEIDNLTKVYPDGTKANDGISIRVRKNEIVGIIGPNGAGKTTLIRQLLGLLKPTEGSIRVMGRDIVNNPDIVKRTLAYVPQYPLSFPSLRVEEVLEYVLRMRGESISPAEMGKRISGVLELLGLSGAAKFFGYQLSGGMKKSLLLAMAIIQELPVLVLDEPTSMVDIVTKHRLWDVIRNSNREGILLASHDMNEVKALCDRVYLLVYGKIVTSGTPADIVSMVKMPTEVRLIPGREIPQSILPKEHKKRGDLYELAFDTLEDALRTVDAILKSAGVSYLEIESPSFENLVINLIGRDGE
ncbi:ABC-type multidrug transport system, ATPase component [Thermococcus kodakarensis KOD1]|uniref:ABC-type multidrug transport system, ATPase component n=1 Tax=Thermococcus kodakarensis (strain ATCC BAA-918 / JCM 12380 / KOD1) TaxID=69014 RepID=Q5JHJ6_THEKO|nr:ABC transporter ATP-binding protein [Thermococcus kodakarensis]WCN28002.1 ABC transporter ATP-binding protein [Thermococcus kodakarensis]WCN30301.1 ABC transporter ATP-binding protein [Thermococcus kodakarensis]BAD86350.1 ABC-type multidrug transport system, ATPase component [Thermococcus kodakarensis KOD1]